MEKIYNLLADPFSKYLPENSKYCSREEINELHQKTCELLKISDVYSDLLWGFGQNFRTTLGEAWWFIDHQGQKQWRTRYSVKHWIAMGEYGRRNTIVHEVCHLGVERLFGHSSNKENPVLDHGKQWRELMRHCGEKPFFNITWNYL